MEGEEASFFALTDGATVLTFGGVWAMSDRTITFSIITLAAVDELAYVHDRMPLLIEPARWQEWLTTDQPGQLLEPPTSTYRAGIELRPVGDAVGDVRQPARVGPGVAGGRLRHEHLDHRGDPVQRGDEAGVPVREVEIKMAAIC